MLKIINCLLKAALSTENISYSITSLKIGNCHSKFCIDNIIIEVFSKKTFQKVEVSIEKCSLVSLINPEIEIFKIDILLGISVKFIYREQRKTIYQQERVRI